MSVLLEIYKLIPRPATAARDHSDSVLALRIVFSTGPAVVFFAGPPSCATGNAIFGRDPEATGDNYRARNLRLWQNNSGLESSRWDLLIMALWNV